ncbi:PEP-CTERM sorting domain-containing protein [Anabaena minutissima FACHB-250]|nr:PEP-CTERM sorting domain-containing protein [Anabaena minutissima FACHB-250]
MALSTFTNRSILAASIISVLGWMSPAQAIVLNGDFSNNLNQWETTGDVSISNGQALLTTASSTLEDDYPEPAGQFNFSGTEVIPIGELETFVGVNPLELGEYAIEGSALKQTFTVQAGDILSFSWQFLTNEETPDLFGTNDAAFIILKNLNSSSNVIRLADTNGVFSPSTTLGFSAATGVNTFKSQSLTAGNYILALAIAGDGDNNVTSALLVDNVKTQPGNAEPVPEPESILGLGTAICLFILKKMQLKKMK